MPERASKGSRRGLSTKVAASPCPLHQETTQVPPGGGSRPCAMSPHPLHPSPPAEPQPTPEAPAKLTPTPHRTSSCPPPGPATPPCAGLHPPRLAGPLPAQQLPLLGGDLPGVTPTEGKFPTPMQLSAACTPEAPPVTSHSEPLPQGPGAHVHVHTAPQGARPPSLPPSASWGSGLR